MKIAAKYTLVLGGTLAIVLAVLGLVRLHYVRLELEHDMLHDHRIVGSVLQTRARDARDRGAARAFEPRGRHDGVRVGGRAGRTLATRGGR